MTRSLRLTLVALLSLVWCDLARSQDTPAPTTTSASAGDEVTKLQEENTALKQKLADASHTISLLQAQLVKAGVTPAAAEAAPGTGAGMITDTPMSTNATPGSTPKALPLDATNAASVTPPGSPTADAGPARTYTVVKGDKLWTISKKMYPGHTKDGVEKIQEANKDTLGTKPLKIGQVLIIPQ